jgi:hypothetical protein
MTMDALANLLTPSKKRKLDSSDSVELSRSEVKLTLIELPTPLELDHGDPWFEDGNIILQVGPLGYCVHKGVLGKHSAAFADMFVVSRSAEDTMPGPSRVELQDDPNDIRCSLEYLYRFW